jgi:hypothetical protein
MFAVCLHGVWFITNADSVKNRRTSARCCRMIAKYPDAGDDGL